MVRRAFILMAVILLLVSPIHAQAPKSRTDGDLGDILNELEAKVGDAWWNPAWKLRRKLTLEGPGLATTAGGVVYFRELDPLLLFNTGRLQDKAADLRIVTPRGKVLSSGVLYFGRDDGSSQVWCQLTPDLLIGKQPTLYAYYQHKSAVAETPPASIRLEPPADPDVTATLGPEEAAPGSKLPTPPPVGSFFKSVVAVEAEQFEPVEKLPTLPVRFAPEKGASAGAVITTPYGAAPKYPIELAATVQIPSAGRWQVHMRSQGPQVREVLRPFKLVVGTQDKFTCGEQATSPLFRWESFAADLPAGTVPLKLILTGPAHPDCVLLARDPAYRPDCRDVTGPVQMRFHVLAGKEKDQPFYIDWYCVHTPYSVDGPQGDSACFLFKDRVAISRGNAQPLLSDAANLLHSGQWSPWGRSLHSRAYTWWSDVRFLSSARRAPPLKNLQVKYQVATRQDDSRIYHEGIEDLTQTGSIRIRMPTGLDQTSLAMIEGFSAWGERRFRMAEEIGLAANQGPRKIVALTMVHSLETNSELDTFLKTCNWLGLNGSCLRFHDEAYTAARSQEYGMIGSVEHPFIYGIDVPGDTQPSTDKSYRETARQIIAQNAEKFYASRDKRPKTWATDHALYGIIGDEIGPAVSSLQINKDPFYQRLFTEYLREQQLEPGFFGASRWEDVQAIDYIVEGNSRLAAALERQRVADETEKAVEQLAQRDLANKPAARPEAAAAADLLQELNRTKTETKTALGPQYEKRLAHWTQKFRSDYTCLFYRECTDALKRHAPAGYRVSVNLQASPAQMGKMWDGGLNIFDLARKRGFDSLFTEDWTGDTYRVAFAMGLLQAAARKHGQDLGSYVVGNEPGGRIMSNLAFRSHLMIFYLYGPLHLIGPVWAEHAPTMKDIGETMRLAGKTEPHLLAAKNRPCPIGLLVANTSETNGRYFNYSFGPERIATYQALCDVGLPVEIVGEEEVLEDKALERYRALYVVDPHVDSRVQQTIKDWVAGGGTLWAGYAALTRQEYDEPSLLFDEVFGLKERGALEAEPAAVNSKTPPPGQKILAKDIAGLKSAEFAGSYCKPKYQLKTGQALATFEDGSPAVVQNTFGKGRAYLVAVQSRGIASRDTKLTPLAAIAAQAAQVEPFVQGIRPQLFHVVHDGPAETVLHLYNDSTVDMTDLSLHVAVPGKIASALSGRTGELTVTGNSKQASIQLSLPARTGDIVVLRHEAAKQGP